VKCPTCQDKTRTVDTRNFYDPNEDFDYVERRHMCENCGHKFQSIEVNIEEWNRRVIADE
jgi:transcriptional regulator NrdR family protein